ncbi:MAG TPA: UxaA family hydrolase [Casimicrobiaceae bacterium]
MAASVETAASARWDALAIHPDDDVAVVLRDLAAGETVAVRRGGAVHRVAVCDAIPLGHKLALRALSAGTTIRKYGESIGAATADIAAGAHVHIHNMASRRARLQS